MGKKDYPFRGAEKRHRWGISKCFRPNRCASMDHAPGPNIASVAPNAANRMGIPPPPAQEKAIHTSTTVINVPQIGVHKPKSKSIPAPAPTTCRKAKANCGASLRCPNPKQNRNVAVTARCRRRPLPGQLFGNAEKRRCKSTPFSVFSLRYWQQAQNAQTEVSASFFWGIYSSIIPRFNPIVTA
jgi:hypothetical protein